MLNNDSEVTPVGSVGRSHPLEITEREVKLPETGFTEHDSNNQPVVKKLDSEQHPASVDQSFQTTDSDPSIDCSSPMEQEVAAEVHRLRNRETLELFAAGRETGPVVEGDECLHSQVAAMSPEKDASPAEDITVPAGSRHSTYSSVGLNASNLSHGADSSESLPEVASKQLQSASFEQPVGKEETGESSYPTTSESSGLSLDRFRISGTALTLRMEDERELDVLLTSSREVDESQPEGLCAVGGLLEEIGVALHPPLHQDMPGHDVEPPPETALDDVTAEYVFPSGEPGFDWDSESMTLGEGELENTCRICLYNHWDCALCPCGHFCCLRCINELRRTVHPAPLKCHICRQVVEEVWTF